MKKIQTLLLGACGYTILVLTLFFLFTAVSDFTEAAITFPTFLIIFAFGILISLAGMILGVKKFKLPLRILIHYAVLMVAFIIVFIINGNIKSGGGATVFSAIVIFTFLYAVIFLITYFVRNAVISADKALSKHTSAEKNEKKKKSEYKSLYKN